MIKNYTFIFLLAMFTNCFSQREANNWYFGQKAGVTFNSGVPVALTNGQLTTLEGSSSISNGSGNLLFYTDGIKVWNKNHAVMANGTNLKGDPSSTQSGIIVPKPGSSTIYYIFTVDMQGGLALFAGGDADGVSNGFMYSEVDMTLNGGLGNVTATKNIALRKPTTEGLSAVKHSNGIDYWVVTHGTNNNQYYAFLVTAAGVNTTPVISSTGPNVTVSAGISGAGAIGYTKISPNGKKIASCHSYENNDLVISDFNAATGVVSNSITINLHLNSDSDGPYGVEFSSCNEYLYVSEQFSSYDSFWGTAWPKETRIWRFDLNAGSIPASKFLFRLVANEAIGALQLASDTKIYCARMIRTGSSAIDYGYGFGNSIHSINNPRIAGATFTNNAVNLAGRTSSYGLPPFIASFFNNSSFSTTNVSTGDTALFCNGDSIQFTGSTNAFDSIRWYFGDPSTGVNNTSTLLNPKHLFSTYGPFNIRFYKYLCGIKDSALKTITIFQYPVITDIFDQNICTGSIVLDATANPATSYTWNTGATTPTITVSTQGGYSVRVNNQGCIAKDSMYLTVGASTPVSVSIAASVNGVCAGTSVTFTATPSTSGLSPNYQWFLNNNPVGTNSNTFTSTTFNNNDQVKVVLSSSVSCITGSPDTSNTVIMNIIPPTPVSVSIAASANNICVGTNVTFTATPSSSSLSPNYQWFLNGNPVGLNTDTYSNSALNNNDQVKVRMSSSVACISGSPDTSNIIVMIVKPNPIVSVNSPSICNSQTVNLSASGATTYTWTGGLAAVSNPSTPVLTTTTTYTVTGTTNGCTSSAVSTVTVNPNPIVSVNSPSICNGQTASLSATGATTYTWTGGLAAVSNPTTPTLTTTTTYTVTGTSNGCTGTAVSTVTVKPNPTVSVNSPSICNGQTASLSANGATTYTWTGGLAAVSNPSTPTLTTTTTYTVIGTTNGCTGTAVSTVTVNPIPTVSVNSPSICNGQTASLSANGATSYTWTGGLAAVSNPTTPTLTTTTTYTVTGTSNGCTGIAVSTVTVNPNPSVSVNNPSICSGESASLSATGATTYTWTGGLAAVSNPTTPTLTTTTTYTVTGTSNGCTGTAVSTVTVKPNPTVSVNSLSICNGQTASLSASGATTYTWTGGLAAVSNPSTPTLTTTTTYTVTGTTNGCTGTAISTVTVKPNPSVSVNNPSICSSQTASLSASGATTYTWTGGLAAISNPSTPVLTTTTMYTVTGTTNGCTGTAISTVTVKPNPSVSVNSPSICNGQTASLSASGATTYSWTGGLAAISNPTTPALTTTTTYTVTGTTNGCTGSAVATVTVKPNPIVSVNNANICPGQTASLTASGAASYSWTGGLAAISNPTTPALTTTTTYTVTGTTSGCTGTAVSTVSINPNLIINVNSPIICSGQTASLTASGAVNYIWSGGLPSVSNPTTPALTTTTTYTVTGNTSGCTGSSVATVTVKPNPVVNVNSPSICSGQTALLTASGATTYTWTGGLAAISNPTTPILTTTTTYTVTGTTNGCTGMAVSIITVKPNPLVSANSPTICSGLSTTLSASGASTYTWTGGLAAVFNPLTPVLTTTTTYTVTGTTAGCTGTANSTVTVIPNPVITVNSPSICSGQTALLSASGASSYTWTGGLASVSSPTTPVLTTTTTFTVTGTTGICTGSATSLVSVKPVKVTNLTSIICQGQSVSIGNQTFTTTGNYTVRLQTSQGCDSTVNLALTVNPTKITNTSSTICQGQSVTIGNQTFTTTGNYTVVLQTSQGCDSTVNLALTVNPTLVPAVNIISNKNNICQGDAVVFTATVSNTGVTPIYQWQVNGINAGINSAQFSSTTLANADVVKVIINTTATCANPRTATSNVIDMVVNKMTYTKPLVEYCKSDSQTIDLLVNTIPSTPFTVKWTNQGTTTTLSTSTYTVNNVASGNIPFEISYGNNCKVNDVLPVRVNPLPSINATSDFARVRYEEQVQLDVLNNAIILTYNWTPSDAVSADSIKNPTSVIRVSTLFTVKVTDNHNCTSSDSVFVELIDECREEFIYVPTAFSPNRDGVNDCFGILSPPVLSNYKLILFNRWGEKVYETTDVSGCWDGMFKGAEAASDSYVYLVSFTCYNGSNLSKNGTVTIVR